MQMKKKNYELARRHEKKNTHKMSLIYIFFIPINMKNKNIAFKVRCV